MKFKIITGLIVGISFILLCALGFWQLSRMQEKANLHELKTINQTKKIIDYDTLGNIEQNRFRRVKLKGKWLSSETFFLDLRKHRGKTGLQVVTPFRTRGGHKVLVKRGWLEFNPADKQLPQITTSEDKEIIQGVLNFAKAEKIDFSNSAQLNKRRMFIAIKALQAKDPELADSLILLDDTGNDSMLETNWQLPEFNSTMHLGYAIQWFAFALILLVGSLYLLFKKP